MVVMPRFDGIRVQVFINQDDSTATFSPDGYPVSSAPNLFTKDLITCAKSILSNSPTFDKTSWQSGVVIEGTLVSANMVDLEWALAEDDEMPDDTHLICDLALPMTFWQTGVDKCDVWMRRSTLYRAMYDSCFLAHGSKSHLALVPYSTANNEPDAMGLAGAMVCSKSQPAAQWRDYPKFTVDHAGLLNMTNVWSAKTGWYMRPTQTQIDDLSL